MWAGTFPYLFVWAKQHDLNQRDCWRMLSTMKRIEEHGDAKPWTALKTASASHSTTTSRMFKSRAKRMPTSIALASVSRAPRGPTVGLLRAAITFPLLSRTITPSPPSSGSQTQPHQSLPCTIQVVEAPSELVRGLLQLASVDPHWPSGTRPLDQGRFTK